MMKRKYKSLIILIFIFVIPTIFSTPLFTVFSNPKNLKNEEYLTPKSSAPPNAQYFNFYKEIIIDHNEVAGTGTYTNFPVLISITDPDLRSDVQSDGDDIAFSSENSWIDHEIELFNQTFNSTHAKLIVWVRVPTLYGSFDTVIRMYYGNSTMNSQENPAGVWVNNYRGVWHLSESTGNALDSTSYGVSGSIYGTINREQNGKVDGAYDFGTDGQLNFGDPVDGHLDFGTGSFTISFWLNIDASTGNYQLPLYKGATTFSDVGYDFETNLVATSLSFRICDGSNIGESPNLDIDMDSWMYITGVVDRTLDAIRIFKNGMQVGSGNSISAVGNINNAKALFAPTALYDLDGLLDEIRICSIQRSAGWIFTEYSNQNDPKSFYTIGPEQIVTLEPPNAHYFTYYKIITIDHNKVAGTGSHTNFPVLISLIDENLRYHAQSDGDDIAFSLGGDWLDHEIEIFNQSYSSTQAQLIAWVRAPYLSTTTNTIITMYYGNSTMSSRQNPAGVWTSDYRGVWHLNEVVGGANAIKDSSSYSNDGTDYNNPLLDQAGKIHNSIGFTDASSQRIEVPDDNSLDISTLLTVEAWIRPDVSSKWMTIISKVDGALGSGSINLCDIYVATNDLGNFDIVLANPSDSYYEWASTVSFSTGTWQHFVFTYQSSTSIGRIYLNGVFRQQQSFGIGNIGINSNPFYIGINRAWTGEVFDGLIDEVRISSSTRSDNWINTQYQNQNDPSSFYSISTEQLVNNLPYNANYFNYYKVITINHNMILGTGSHINFPFLISLLDNDLHNDVQSDGDDIAFAMDGTWLDHEIEIFNQSYSSTDAEFIAWVRIPFLSTAFDTNITMYYGNSTMSSRERSSGVWISGYVGVWHLNEDPSGTPPQIKDRTLPSSDGSSYGTMTNSDQVGGMIDGALDFDGSNDYIDFGNTGELQITGEITVQAWFKADNYIDNDYLVAKHGGAGFRGWDISFDDDPAINPDGWIMFRYSPDGTSTITTGYERVRVGQWYHVVGVFKPNDFSKLFFNGTEVAIITTGVPSSMYNPPLPLRIARRSDSSASWFDGIIDEVRISNTIRSNDWIETEYNNQIDPSSFYSVGAEQYMKPVIYLTAQINALDLYNNLIPNATISMYQNIELIKQDITGINGSVIFTNILEGEYNFTVSISSNIGSVTEIVNVTSQAILLDQPFQTINLICDVSTHFFEIVDVDSSPVESGWIIVGNATQPLQKCVIDSSGHTKFWWVDEPPSFYNYSVYYSNPICNPPTIRLATGDITTFNETIPIQVNLTTVEFTVLTFDAPIIPVSGVKLKLTVNDPLGLSIANLTTNINGKATLKWLTSFEISGDYCLQIEFYGRNQDFNRTVGGIPEVNNYTFTVVNKDSYEFRFSITGLSNFQTELISLNPTDYIEIEWGSVLKLRTLFNVSKVEEEYKDLLGPTYADSMRYDLLFGGIPVKSGTFSKEIGNLGRHFIEINTNQLESDKSYIIIISAYKSGFIIPSDLILQLDILNNDLELNQSENVDSDQSVYWLETANMTLSSYGSNSEMLTIENALFQNINHEFDFLISDLETHWNLSKIILNLYNISWNVGISDINITVEDPFGNFYMFHSSNHSGWDYLGRTWKGITLNINKASLTHNNIFEFIIGGSFDSPIDIIADAYFIRDSINVQYSKFNVSNEISLLTEVEGWTIDNITFEIFECYNTSNWSVVDLSSLSILNISTNEGFIYALDHGYTNGTGSLTIDDRQIYSIGNQFVFTIESQPYIIFNAIIYVEYVQGFYQNLRLETFNLTIVEPGITNGGMIQVDAGESHWNELEAFLWVKEIKSGSTYFLPSDLAMNITIGGQKYAISDVTLGMGTFSLRGFTKEQILHAVIETAFQVNFTLQLSIKYSRTVSYETIGSLSYSIVENPSIYGTASYYPSLGYYLKTIDTSLLDTDQYTVRFTLQKAHFGAAIKDLNLNVLNRPTLLNQSSDFFRKIESIYIKDTVNFTFVYTDAISGAKIANLETKYYLWERYDQAGNVIESGQGNIITATDNTYILDFNTQSRLVGEYLLIVILERINYDYKNAMLFLTIKKREIGIPILSDNFQNRQTSVVKGNLVPIQLILTDPTKNDIRLLNATVILTMGGNVYNFTHIGNGVYTFTFSTNNVDAFFTSVTFTGTINITKEDYISQEFDIIIVVEMEQIFPGMPTFYFLLILAATIAIVGSIVGYRVYHYAKIPAFVRRVRAMKKAIKKDDSIAESLLYSDKQVFIGKIIKKDWAKIGLSIEEILGITIEKEKEEAIIKGRPSQITKTQDKKPGGLFLMKWDERIGMEVLSKYPEDIQLSSKTLMQIYSTHEYSGEKGIIMLTTEGSNLLSYYAGPEQGYYLVLILGLDDDPDLYEGGMANILQTLLENREDELNIQMVKPLFQRLSLYPSLSSEESLALAYHNKIIRTIINLLRDDGVITKSELTILLKDKYMEGFFDMEAILNELVKLEIIKISSVKKIPSELVFLTNDIFILRIPPLKLLDKPTSHGLPRQFTTEYPNDVTSFFQNYRPAEEDNIKIAKILTNPQVYETLRLLRTAIVTRQDLEKLRQKGVDDIYGVLKILWDNQMIKVYHDDKNIEYYALLSDVYIEYLFPKYLLKAVKIEYEQKSKNKKALIEYLTILEEVYFNLKNLEKSKGE